MTNYKIGQPFVNRYTHKVVYYLEHTLTGIRTICDHNILDINNSTFNAKWYCVNYYDWLSDTFHDEYEELPKHILRTIDSPVTLAVAINKYVDSKLFTITKIYTSRIISVDETCISITQDDMTMYNSVITAVYLPLYIPHLYSKILKYTNNIPLYKRIYNDKEVFITESSHVKEVLNYKFGLIVDGDEYKLKKHKIHYISSDKRWATKHELFEEWKSENQLKQRIFEEVETELNWEYANPTIIAKKIEDKFILTKEGTEYMKADTITFHNTVGNMIDFNKNVQSVLDSLSKLKTKNAIKKVIFNDPATIIIWGDGSKTVVKAQDGEPYDKEKGMALCISKKALGNTSKYYEAFKRHLGENNG